MIIWCDRQKYKNVPVDFYSFFIPRPLTSVECESELILEVKNKSTFFSAIIKFRIPSTDPLRLIVQCDMSSEIDLRAVVHEVWIAAKLMIIL